MSIATHFRYGIAFAILSVFLTVSVYAQVPATPDVPTPTTAATLSATPSADALPTDPTTLGLPNPMQQGMSPSSTTGAMPLGGMPIDPMSPMGMQPQGAMGGMPIDPMMSPMGMGMRQGPYMGYDPEMNAMLTRQLQDLRMQETQLTTEIIMSGGETSPIVQPLLTRRAMLQNRIRALEAQLGVSGTGATATPGAMGMMQPHPMGNMPMGMQPPGMQPGMPGYPADLMAQQRMASQGLPPGRGADPYYGTAGMGAGSNRLLLTTQRQEAVTELQYAQRMLSFLGPNDPQQAIIVAQQEDLTARIAAIDKQLEQIPTPVAPMQNAAGSTAPTLADSIARQPNARPNTVMTPEIAQMQYAAQQLRATRPDLADDMQRRIELAQSKGFVEPQLPPGMALTPNALLPPMVAPPVTTPTLPMAQQGELAELRSTVDSLRSEINSLRQEIRALNAILNQWNQPQATNGWYDAPVPSQPETDELPVLPTYTGE